MGFFGTKKFNVKHDPRKKNNMTDDIEQRNKMLHMINLATISMLTTIEGEEFEEILLSALELICRCMDVDRAHIWKNEVIDNELYFVLKYKRLSEIGMQKTPVPIGLKFPYSSKIEWRNKFLHGEHINSPCRDLPPEDQGFLKLYDIKSIVIIPLHLQDDFWGLLSIDDCQKERVFSSEEINILRSISLMMASTMNKYAQTAKINEADELTQLMLDANPYSCILWDRSFNCLLCNQATVNLFRLNEKRDFIDRFDDFSPEYQPCGRKSSELSREYVRKTFDKEFQRFEWMHRTMDGKPLPVEMTLVRVKHRDEYVVAAYVRDLSEHKAMLAEMKKTEDDLKFARDAAEAANKAKSAFLANMSHEIRTPMNSIVGFSELAMNDECSPKTREYLDKILENTNGLLHIINDILDLTKVESGKMELEKIPFDLRELFSGCRTLSMPKAVEKGIIVHFYAEPSIGKMLMGDPTRLRQVLVNLLSNAIKFTNSGMVKLYSSIREKTENTVTIHFEVKDSGIGITSEQMEKIFEPFTQAETGTTRKYGGTGLGLSITKNIIELMGGTLSVESVPGTGSKFSFDLTFETVDVSDDIYEQKSVFNEFKRPIFSAEILLCEDNLMNQQVICEHLTRVGIKTVVAGNGRIGVDLVRQRLENGEKLFDLIFMDMHMPVMDGLEGSAKIMELKTGIPIVAMTANIMSGDREIYKMSGMNDCVGKPFTSHELWHCLMKYLTPVGFENIHRGVYAEKDTDFQRELEALFIRRNKDKYNEIIKALEDNDIKLAHRLAHTLKGNSGQIGKSILQQAAANVEQLLKDGKNMVTQGLLVLLETELQAVLDELSPVLEETHHKEDTSESGREMDKGSALELLDKLKTMLEMGNPECCALCDDLLMIGGGDELARRLVQQIDDFDFELAGVTLGELRKKLENA